VNTKIAAIPRTPSKNVYLLTVIWFLVRTSVSFATRGRVLMFQPTAGSHLLLDFYQDRFHIIESFIRMRDRRP
jgi:hypothetical protein